MDSVLSELTKLLVPAVAAAILGGLKYLYPKVRDKVPNFLWPFAVYGLTRAGTAACQAVGEGCTGNPFEWSPTTVNAMAATLIALVVREVSKSVSKTEVGAKLTGLLKKLTPGS